MANMRQAARSLVATRDERFESRHGLAESRSRLEATFSRAGLAPSPTFTTTWSEEEGRAILVARFAPPPRALVLLKALSVGMATCVAASVWAIVALEGPLQFALPLFTGLAILGVPLVTLALSSQRDAYEARVRRAIRAALLDEPERLAARSWDEES